MIFAVRNIVISLLVPVVSGSCLSDAIPPANRQNLVNPNGETYPVGVYISNYAASFAAQYLGAAIIEEVLGYNTVLNTDALGSGSVAGYYSVTGCRDPNNVADRGCMQGVTYYHVHFESWYGYPSDWANIRKAYPSMAPKNLGSMGYDGFTSIYIPKPIQEQAYATEGLALQYYRSYNSSWHDPAKYFGLISSVDTSKLMPCTASVMSDDTAMRRHVQFTNDQNGVVISNELYSGRCDDGFWWLAPSCRANSSRCFGFLTGGTGWGAEEQMQKYVAWNMPGAVGVAASWGDYVTLPLSGEMMVYWWTPDPTFLDLAALPVQFPPYNHREFSANILTSMPTAAEINTIVSQDLAILAPTVEKFADNLQLTLSQMDTILLDQKNTGDSWENVTCRWIKANRAVWQKWIPDESECAPGFGLFDYVLRDFTNKRVNATNKIVCEACPPGTFSQMMSDDKGDTHICLPCGMGTSQPSGAALSCTPCKSGEYQDENRSTECKRCSFGTYQDEEGQLGCKSCPDSTITLGFGSTAPSDCGCPEKEIDMNRLDGFECVPCMEGMSCPALSQLVDLESGTSVLGPDFTPKIQAGFYAIVGAPTEVFKCRSFETCPGGPPGTCGGGLIGIPCAECPAGSTWTGSVCEDCAGWRQALWVLAVLAIFGFLTLAYYLATSKVPLLNVTDCVISFCIVLLVTTSTLYLNKIDSTMYAFASAVLTAMLSGIGVAIGIMVLMTTSALFYRSAMGGKKELTFFNLGRVATSEELARKVKDLAVELEKANAADLSTQLKALSVFDTQKITTCITLLATEVAPPAEDGRSFKFNKRIASGSFDPALKRKPQSRQFSSREELAPKVPQANEESNEVNQTVETPEKKDTTMQSSWI